MPCDSSYLAPNWSEKEASKLLAIYDEVINGKDIQPEKFGDGRYNGHYAQIEAAERDVLVKAICDSLRASDIKTYSLEVQMWWRDHLKADEIRKPGEL